MTSIAASRGERLAAGGLVGGAVVFAVLAVTLPRVGGGLVRAEMLTLLFALLAADVLIAAALLTAWYPVRPVAQGLAIFGAVVYLFVLLRSGPWWMRGWSGLLVAAHAYALVLLFALGSREHYEDDEDDRPDDAAVGEPVAEAPEPVAEVPEPAAEAPEPAAEAPEPAESAPEDEPVAAPVDDGIEVPAAEPVADPADGDEPGKPEQPGEPDPPGSTDLAEPVESAVGTARPTPTGATEEEA